ncbi:hypothetical protein B5M09_013721 [Aphanomyces astaci]|uniref:Peptidase S1 domain-containing protein n=1 Tax=Aphanomyces astaci TaxID=112090 RepID=A0A3R7WNH6_APHAT|nr:hypothetical protein B5M09_013721 [Aphanomyces astaci]
MYLTELLKFEITRPTVILADNLGSHVSESSVDTVSTELFGILAPLPKNSTSECQPLDVGVMGPLKSKLRKKWLTEKPVVTAAEKRLAMIQRTIQAWEEMSCDLIRSSFEKAKCLSAHCLKGKLRAVVVGTHYLTGFADGELANITQEIKHPKGTDVGIVILDRNITTIQPVAVSFEFVPADVLAWVRGWGRVTSRARAPYSKVLKELSVTTWNNTGASAALFPIRLTDTMLGAGGVEGEDSCRGDSGGPLTIEENGTVRLVGVISFGRGCGVHGNPGNL